MMTITIKLFASLREGRFDADTRELAEGDSLAVFPPVGGG